MLGAELEVVGTVVSLSLLAVGVGCEKVHWDSDPFCAAGPSVTVLCWTPVLIGTAGGRMLLGRSVGVFWPFGALLDVPAAYVIVWVIVVVDVSCTVNTAGSEV